MIVILINGIALSGKDTFVRCVLDEIKKKDHPLYVTSVSTIDPVKEIYATFFGWNGKKTDKDRKNLNILKNMWVQVSNGPVRYSEFLLNSINQNPVNNLVFIMVREYTEMISLRTMIRSNGWECLTLCVQRSGIPVPPVEQEFLDGHPSDYKYDMYAQNPTVDTYPEVPVLEDFATFFCKFMVIYGEKQ